MRIAFELEWNNPIPKLKHSYRKLVCSIKGHNLRKYQKPKIGGILGVYYDSMLLRHSMWRTSWEDKNYDEIPNKQCGRCGHIEYRRVKRKKSEGKAVTFKRYSPREAHD